MRRTLVIACAIALLLSACQSEKKAEPAPTPAPIATGNLCERILPKLTGKWKVASAGPSGAAPLKDSCRLIDIEAPQHMVRVSLSILPVDAAEAVRLRKETAELNRLSHVAAKLMDGGLGEGSWTLDPAAAAPELGFRTSERMVWLSGDGEYGADYRSDRSSLTELREMAKVITELPNGLPKARLPSTNRAARVELPQRRRFSAARRSSAVAERQTAGLGPRLRPGSGRGPEL